MKIRLGIDVACRAAHQASCADDTGQFLWAGHRFRTDPADLDELWAKLPADHGEVTVIMEPTRNAWVPLAAWFRRHGAVVVMVPPEQSADLRDYFNKHAKSDRLDSKVLARLPLLHPEGITIEASNGPADALKRAVKIRSGLVHRRTTSMQRLDCLLELMGPAWVAALGSDMTKTAFDFSHATPTRTPCVTWDDDASRTSYTDPVAARGPTNEPARSFPQRRPRSHCGATSSTSMNSPPTSQPKPDWRSDCATRSTHSTSASQRFIAPPTRTASFVPPRASASLAHHRFSDDSATPTDSATSPESDHSPASCPDEPTPDTPRAPLGESRLVV